MFLGVYTHFIHSPFYVYAYAFGDCLVNSLYSKIEESPVGFNNKYLDLLYSGDQKLSSVIKEFWL